MTSERERQATWEPTTENDVLPVTRVTQEEPTDAEGRDEMRGDLRAWGIGLIVLGVAQYFFPFLEGRSEMVNRKAIRVSDGFLGCRA